jgi:hypothetical protein
MSLTDAQVDAHITDHERDYKARELAWLEREERIHIRTGDYTLDISSSPQDLYEAITESPDCGRIFALLVGNTNTEADPLLAAHLAKEAVRKEARWRARDEARTA